MSKDDTLTKHTMNLFSGDYARLQQYYPDIGAATIIRRVVRAFVNQIEEKGAADVAAINVEL